VNNYCVLGFWNIGNGIGEGESGAEKEGWEGGRERVRVKRGGFGA
jgi:hypothetical protein